MSSISAMLLDLSSESDSESELELETLCYAVLLEQKGERSDYTKKRETHGEFALTKEFDDDKFQNYFRLNRVQFKEVHDLIQNEICREGCNASRPIGTEEKLAVFLKYLATGNSYRDIAFSYRLGERTVSNIVLEVSQAVWKIMQPLFLPEPTKEQWESIEVGFDRKWQFPHCIGAIDGKHVVIKKTGKTGSSYLNYKHTLSVVVMAIADSDYKFIAIDVGSPERFSDGSIFNPSVVAKEMIEDTLHIPLPVVLSPIEDPMPFVFVGSEAFPLFENLMRPYPKRSVTDNDENKVFNYRLSRARQTVECSFSILSSCFRIFRAPFEIKVNSVISVIKAACVLHNYLRISVAEMSEEMNEEKMPKDQLRPLLQSNFTRSSQKALTIRQNFTTYFNTT
ncbi:uncharacterized protein GBIM_03812 [Gryllus bimaculatus]|nr:uncharacterized protein GBIM_03812 [Gryllus bimaculatus]